ncbi:MULTISPECIES: response regulator transcription factor [Pseudomonadota]|uniref:response regulator transcription factor n=1 Tax=Pseudomonadota TaxID=1224 RepID=UPI0022310229|nr:LuxR C-terminal-related transcriptional regulator [Burkholderia cenocepacia]MCW3663992.1 LuxR C-terminal-related transcriptional regulator [Burkholderia cenocepacia]
MNNPTIRNGFQAARASMMDLLGSYFRDASITISRLNPIARKHESICSIGYDQDVLEFLNSSFIDHDEHMMFMRSSNLTYLDWNSLPERYHGAHSAKKYFIAHGYHDGATQRLFTAQRQYTGVLHINTKTADSISKDAQRLIFHSAPLLASITDWWLDIISTGQETADDDFLFVIVDQQILCQRGEPATILGTRTIEKVLLASSENRVPDQFYMEDCHGKTWLMKAIRKQRELVLYARPAAIPLSITPRELDIAGWLAGGFQSKEIARGLNISERTVSHHIENLLRKLGLHNRSSAAVFCYQKGILTLR